MKTASARERQLFLGLLAVITLVLNADSFMNGLHRSVTRPQWVASPPPSAVKLPPPFWANAASPKQVLHTPSELGKPMAEDGSYIWTNTFHPDDDIEYRMDNGWNIRWQSTLPQMSLQIAYPQNDGQYADGTGLVPVPSYIIR